jgi:pimeloyl-ACP methyl ester carboxylesterase
MPRCPMLLSLLMFLVTAAPANHQAQSQLVDVGDGVKVEVLDWGGFGSPVLLLSGSGNTAHMFEDFAPKLIACCRVHVYGITRRGYGASSKPERGYSTPELAEDDWRIIDALKLQKPVVIGHSMAGSEMTFLAQKHSSALAALVYLDANADPIDYPWSNAEFRALTMKAMKNAPGPQKEQLPTTLLSRPTRPIRDEPVKHRSPQPRFATCMSSILTDPSATIELRRMSGRRSTVARQLRTTAASRSPC